MVTHILSIVGFQIKWHFCEMHLSWGSARCHTKNNQGCGTTVWAWGPSTSNMLLMFLTAGDQWTGNLIFTLALFWLVYIMTNHLQVIVHHRCQLPFSLLLWRRFAQLTVSQVSRPPLLANTDLLLQTAAIFPLTITSGRINWNK